MNTRTNDLRIMHSDPITAPAQLQELIPLTPAAAACVAEARQAIVARLGGRDPRPLAILGPCSVHDVDAAREYAAWLHRMRARYSDDLQLIMRCYFEKPRTTTGWKGLINDPHLNGSHDMETGVRLARQLLVDCNAAGIPTATEILDPVTPQYLADAIAWTAIGARTTESQTHREMASGLSMPVGFKNGTDGQLSIALNAMESARAPHAFRGIDAAGRIAIVTTTGNHDGHLVLRGSSRGTNYDEASIASAVAACRARELPERVLIDCSHGNSRKDPQQQLAVAAAVGSQLAAGSDAILGLMVESNLLAGRQDLPSLRIQLRRGLSITDACIDCAASEVLLENLATAVRQGRRLATPLAPLT